MQKGKRQDANAEPRGSSVPPPAAAGLQDAPAAGRLGERDSSGAAGGFTLLEVAIALAILALLLVAVATADSVAVKNASRHFGYTRAAQLMRGVVLDIEAEYQEDGFPENSKYSQRCEVPRDFDDQYKCEYDLLALEFEPSELSGLVEQGVQNFMGGGTGDQVGFPGDEREKSPSRGRKKGGESGGESGGGASTLFPEVDLSSLASTPGMEGLAGLDTSSFAPSTLLALAPLFGPDGPVIQDLCQINLEAMIAKFVAMSAFFPMVIEEAARQTRKLKVRLTWKFGPRKHRELAIETFIVGLPEEEMRKIREAEDAAGAMEDLNALRSPDGGVPSRSGTRGAAREGTE